MTDKENNPEKSAPWEFQKVSVMPAGDSPVDTADLQKIIRSHYREPISEDDAVRAEIDGHSYRVCDISNRGAGIRVPTQGDFVEGALCTITLHLGVNAIAIRGRIAHLSPLKNTGISHCGVEFIDLSPKSEEALQGFLSEHHARLFGNKNIPAEPDRD